MPNYIGTTINESPVVTGVAAAEISAGSFLVAKFDGNGKIVKAGAAGEKVLGLMIAETNGVAAGDDVTIQIKDQGLWTAGAPIAAGALLTTDANGKAVTASAAGQYILAMALEAASAADKVIHVAIIHGGSYYTT